MARLDAAADGTLLRAVLTAADARTYPDAHPGTAAQLTFDEVTNAALVADLHASTDPYRLAGGVLSKNGQPVPINAPDAATTERTAATSDLQAQAAAAMTALDAIIARNGTFTLAQAGQAIDVLAKGQRKILRLLVAQLS